MFKILSLTKEPLERIVGMNVAKNRDLAHGVDLRAIVALKRVVGQILQMDVTVPLVELVFTNVP